jgi:pimeloyl-ACP methyl ester carboxylesterase
MPDTDDDLLDRLEASARRTETPCGDGAMVWHEWGEGPPLVLLHGGSGSWRHWARNIGHLSRGQRVLAPDMPGLGESAMPPAGTRLWDYAGLLADGIDATLGAGTRYDLAGFSFGAVMSGHLAARDTGRLRSVTLLGAGSLGLQRRPTPLAKVRSETGENRIAAHRHNLATLMIADPARIDALALRIQAWNSDHTRLRSSGLVPEGALREALRDVTAPLNVIYGERDAIVYPFMDERTALYHALRPDVTMRVVPGAGHWVAFEAADAVNALLDEMLPAV